VDADVKNGNILAVIPATEDCKDRPSVCLQGHWDIVAVTSSDNKSFDFSTQPIKPLLLEDGKWLTADRTSLGADNGIGIALGLAYACEKSHPMIELLVTADEEIGLVGAGQLPIDWITSKYLLNLDSEEKGIITISGA
ncbi:peptidase M20C, Xaa-His dipeptidase, partial [Kipferlia bialata]